MKQSMITRQRLTPVQWKAEVEKMILWGAPLPAEARAAAHRLPLAPLLRSPAASGTPQDGDQGDGIAGAPGSGVASDAGREYGFRPAPLRRELRELPRTEGPGCGARPVPGG